MMINDRSRRRLFRGAVLTIGATGIVATLAAIPYQAPGSTYRVRVSTRTNITGLPEGMGGGGGGGGGFGGGGGGSLMLGRATSDGVNARIEVTSMEPVPPGMTLDDFLLVLDSGRVVAVNAEAKTFADVPTLAGLGGIPSTNVTAGARGMFGGGRGGDGGGGDAGGGGAAGRGRAGGGGGGGGGGAGGGGRAFGGRGGQDITLNGLTVKLESLGAGETIENVIAGAPPVATQHYRITTEFSIDLMGTATPIKAVSEIWSAKLPVPIVNPFELGATSQITSGGLSEMAKKLAELRKQIEGTPVRMITTTSASAFGASEVGPRITVEQVTTSSVSAVAPADVDPATLKVPEGFTRRAGFGRGGPPPSDR